ncbi:MAG: CHASE2 domain-containing protein [Gammaproteobacteria bacterium]
MGKVVQRQDKSQVKWLYQAPFYLVGLVALFMVLNPGGFATITRTTTNDIYQRLLPRSDSDSQSVRVVHVDIDVETTRRLGRWPWPRTLLADLNDRVHDLGARTVLLDLVLSERDPTSPDQLIETWWNQPGMSALVVPLSRLPDHDAQLAQSLARGNVVTSFAYTSGPSDQKPLRKAGFQESVDWGTLTIPNYTGTVTTIPSLSAASSGIGSQYFQESDDLVTRNIPLVGMVNGTIYPNQILETVRVSEGVSHFNLLTRRTGDVSKVIGAKIGDITVPTNEDGSLSLYYSRTSEQPSYPAWQVLRPDFDATALRNDIVIDRAECFTETAKSRLSFVEDQQHTAVIRCLA